MAMKTIHGSLLLAMAAGVFVPAVIAQMPAYNEPGPVPAAISAAKTVFVSNGGADAGLFPAPFSGDQDRAYTEFCAALKTTGKVGLVGDPAQADLVLELRLTAPYGPSEPNRSYGAGDPLPMFRLVVYDRKSHYILWTVTHSIGGAVGQKSHDKTFDAALWAVLSQFLEIAGKPPVATP
jgi:hypothetical protein